MVVQGDSLRINLDDSSTSWSAIRLTVSSGGALTRLGFRAGLAAIGGHTNVYGSVPAQSSGLVEAGRWVGVHPSHELCGGSLLLGLRQEVLSRAEVLSIDLHDNGKISLSGRCKTSASLFFDAVLPACALSLSRTLRTRRDRRRRRREPLGSALAAPEVSLDLGPSQGPSDGAQCGRKGAGGHPSPSQILGTAFGLVRWSRPASVTASLTVASKEVYRSFGRPTCGLDGTFQFKGTQREAASAWYLPPASYVS